MSTTIPSCWMNEASRGDSLTDHLAARSTPTIPAGWDGRHVGRRFPADCATRIAHRQTQRMQINPIVIRSCDTISAEAFKHSASLAESALLCVLCVSAVNHFIRCLVRVSAICPQHSIRRTDQLSNPNSHKDNGLPDCFCQSDSNWRPRLTDLYRGETAASSAREAGMRFEPFAIVHRRCFREDEMQRTPGQGGGSSSPSV